MSDIDHTHNLPLKRCVDCGEEKLLTEFYRLPRRNGYYAHCKRCRSIKTGHIPFREIKEGLSWCTKCEQYLPRNDFSKSKEIRTGCKSWCKQCVRISRGYEARIVYAANNGVRLCSRCKREFPDTFEYFRKGRGKPVQPCKQCHRLLHKEYRTANNSRLKEKEAYRRITQRDSVRRSQRKYTDSHKEQIRQRSRQNYNAKRQEVYVQRRAARKRGFPDCFSTSQWARCLDYFNHLCAVCGRPAGLWHTLAMDHWIPLSSPDCPGTISTNIVPLCHGIDGCNNSKGSKNAKQWLIENHSKHKAVQILSRVEQYFQWVVEQDRDHD